MKFTNGQWLLEPGYEFFSPKEVYFERVKNNTLILTLPTQPIKHRGDTLGGVNLTMEITTPSPEAIRVRCFHHAGQVRKEPHFDLNEQANDLDFQSNEQEIRVISGHLSLVIDKKNFSMAYYRDDELLTTSTGRDYGYIASNWNGHAYYKPTYESTFMHQNLSLSIGELIYGLGERFTPFVKNGQSIDIWNEDGGTSTYQSYKNIPFYLTNKGYGVFVNHPEKVSFEVGSENVKKVGFSVQGESLDYVVINGPSIKSVLSRYTSLTGKPALPAPWTFGLWLSTSFTTNYNEKTVMEFIHGMIERNIPLSVFHFDCFWMKDFHWSNFKWDERVFEDPKGLISKIHSLRIKVCVWINSDIAQESELFNEGVENGYFIKKTDGTVWQWDMWQPGMAIVDFTNPEATKWFQSKLTALLDMGVDCFKTDFGERIPTDVIYHDGSDPYKMHNYYTHLYNKAVFDLLKDKKGEKDAILFARSATAGGQKFPVHWGGDCWSNYESMAESLRGGLSLMMSGFGFWSHDIGGFESTSSADVYKRWCAFGLLSSHSRLHGSTSYRVPWAYDQEAVDVLRHFVNLKHRLMPYLFGLAIEAHQTGLSTMRSMIMEFSDDLNTHYLDRQYMLGEALLVAPIMNEQGIGKYYLPKGKWTNYFTKTVYEGGAWITDSHDYFSLPLWVRENTILPIGNHEDTSDYCYHDSVDLQVYECLNHHEIKRVIYNSDELEELSISVQRNDDSYTVQLMTDKPCSITFINCHLASTEVPVQIFGNNSIIMLDKPQTTQTFNLKIK